MQKLVEINSNCMDWRNNESANKAILGGATLYRTAGGNVNAIMPSLLRVTARQLAKGYNVSISANMHSECGEKGFCSNVLNGSAHARGLVKSRIISRYNGLAPKSRDDLISQSRMLTQDLLEKNFASGIAQNRVQIHTGIFDVAPWNAIADRKEKRLIISKPLKGMTYDQINERIGVGKYAYYLHADVFSHILPDTILAHQELQLNDIRFLSLSKGHDSQMEKWMSTLMRRPEAKAAEIKIEKAY